MVPVSKATLHNVHPPTVCAGRTCIIHSPTQNFQSTWPQRWRSDRQIMERICPCGIGHYDIDQADYHKSVGQAWQNVHGCCGACYGEGPCYNNDEDSE